jgi:Protein of unknown function (DUF1501)
MLTGYRQFAGDEYPGFGSVAAKVFGWDRTIPPYVAIPDMIGDAGPGYLGAEGSPFIAGDPGNGNYQVANITLAGGVNEARLSRRRTFLRDADSLTQPAGGRAPDRADDPVAGMQRFYEKAYDLITSAETKQAFDIHKEDGKLRDEYGRHGIGQGCLLARRLVESGVRFVTVQRGGWDNHGAIFPSLRNGNLPQLDQALATLLRDLEQRGMLADTLVVCMGEFGRTPKLNKDAGRDHWAGAGSMLFAGAGVQPGNVIGATDKLGAYPTRRPVGPADVAYTVFDSLGIDPRKQLVAPDGRPIEILDQGELVKELF